MTNPEHANPQPGPEVPAGEGFIATLRRLGPASVLAVISLTLPPLGGFALLAYINPIADWLVSHEQIGLIIYAVAFAVLAGLALLPTYSQSILGGWAFGTALGIPAALAGFLGGALIGYAVAYHASGDRVDALMNEKPRWRAVRDALVGSGFWRTLGIVTLIRVPPNSPFAATNLVMSSVRVPLVPYAVGTLVGMAPRTAAAVWLGHSLRPQFASLTEALKAGKPPWLLIGSLVVTVVIVFVILGVIGHIANKAIAKVVGGAEETKRRGDEATE